MKVITGIWVCLFVALLSCQSPEMEREILSQPLLLQIVKGKISLQIDSMYNDLDFSAKRIAEKALNYDIIRSELVRISKNHPHIEDFYFIDNKGILKIAEPKAYARYEGSSVTFQEHNQFVKKQRLPVFSEMFDSAEGFNAIGLQVPVFRKNEFYGSLNMLIRPEIFLDDMIRSSLKGLPFQIWIVQPDGKLIYDLDLGLIGKNILTDSLFHRSHTITELMKSVVNTKEGYRKAESVRNDTTYKWENFWTTLNLFNNQWRIVLSRESSQINKSKKYAGILTKDAISREIQFKKLARNVNFLKDIASGNMKNINDYLRDFYKSNTELYCVEWVNDKYQIVAGYPKENSIIGYSFFPVKNRNDKVIIDKVNSMRENKFNLQLFGGHYGRFYAYPLLYNGRYYGLLYYILTTFPKSEGNYIL